MIANCDWGVLPGMDALAGRVAVTAIASRSLESARVTAARFGIPDVFVSLDEMLSADLDAIINLTPIPVHAETSKKILAAGMHLVSEKPLASTLPCANELIELAKRMGKQIICSPPRMIDPSRVRAKELLVSGEIGQVAFARVRSSHAGPAAQAWPADPRWFYENSSGPLLDMGVYGIQEITGLLGPARRVFAASGRTVPERIAAGGPFDGLTIPVTADDNVIVVLEFDNDRYAVIDCTFNVRASRSPATEIFGLHGTIALNDNRPDASPIELYRIAADGVAGEWMDARDDGFGAREAHFRKLRRASLLEHLADVIDGAENVLNGAHARHSLEIMLAAKRSAVAGRRIDLVTAF